MNAIITCLSEGHDRLLLIASALICMIGVYASFAVARHAGRSEGIARRNWSLVGVVAAGCTAWSTHMVALLAYEPNVPAAFDLPLTALALLLVIAGIGLSMGRVIGSRDRWRRFSSGIFLGLSVTILHYLGQFSYQVAATISWDLPLAVGSAAIGIAMFGAAMVMAVERNRAVQRLAPLLLFSAIAVVHIGGMTAMTLFYNPFIVFPPLSVSPSVLAPVVAGVCFALIVLAFLGLRFSLQAQAQSRRDRMRLRELSNLALEGLVVCDGDVVTIANDSFARLAGVPPDDVVGRRITDLLPTASPFEMAEREEYDTALAQPEGPSVPVRVLRSRVKIGAKDQTVFAFRDQRERLRIEEITRTREAELGKAKLAAEEGVRAKSLFLATVSHELRTPLHGIMGMIELMRDTGLSDTQRSYVDTMTESSDGLLLLVNMLLDFTRLEESKVILDRSPFDLARAVRSVVNMLAPLADAKGITLSCDTDTARPPRQVEGDAGRFRQILTNIIGNAIKFTDTGSVIVRLSWTDGQCRVEVQDTGMGIPPDRLAAIFEPFIQGDSETTRRFGGTGLGLSISRMLARHMDGDIDVRSAVGEGSTFVLLQPLPLAAENHERPSDVGTEALPDLAEHSILVVDDNRTNRFLVERYLDRAKARVYQAEDGLGAVSNFDLHRPDAIVMDISMPGMNGIDATRKIRAQEEAAGRRCVIIGLSANAFEEDRSQCLDAGMDGFLAKPVSRGDLIRALSGALNAGSAQL